MSKNRQIHDHYEHRITNDRENYDILNWASSASQLARFEVFAASVPIEGRTVLDVGSGLGDLYEFLKAIEINVEYTGVDIIEKMTAAAKDRHPSGHFICCDIFDDNSDFPGGYDVVFCSGMFNLNLGNNQAFLKSALLRMMELTTDYLVFNMLHKRACDEPDRYYYTTPDESLSILKPHAKELRVLDDYLPNDFTIICRK
ncbi:MAG TPA: class I SAM-dependent methyltransferase [Phycisphaerae bacterium]|nr:class I SAM-dependent methyltransferase [Phycisphaerae bacterium]